LIDKWIEKKNTGQLVWNLVGENFEQGTPSAWVFKSKNQK
jgi:hypothetical protein